VSLSRFDDIADLFDQVTDTPVHARLRRNVRWPLGDVRGLRVLDLGAGPGGLAIDLARDGARVLAVDGAGEMLARARARIDREGLRGVSLVRADAHHLPLADAAVDHAAGMLVLHLLDDPVAGLREARRVVRPGGGLSFLTQSDDFGPDAAARLREPLDDGEAAFLEGCARSAAAHARLDRAGWARAFAAAGLPAPTISRALPGVAWVVFARRPEA
jgi:ubiquinone/menaquinone biosynthesis C-methylase UbiE